MTGADDDKVMEMITVDVADDSADVPRVSPAGGDDTAAPASKLPERRTRLQHVSKELKRLKRSSRVLDRSKTTGAGLKFIATKTGGEAEWPAVSKKFDELTKPSDGLLHSSQFAQCIGAYQKSTEFAQELFYALARRKHIKGDTINKAEFRDFWMDLVNESFDSRLRIFLDMVDKDDDGRITKEEVTEILILTASTNRLSDIKKKAGVYSNLIMETLDPDDRGYIMIETLEALLLRAPIESTNTDDNTLMIEKLSQTQKPTHKTKFGNAKYFFIDYWKRLWILTLWLVVCCGLFTYKFVQYKKTDPFKVMGYCLCVAKGGAETLKFNMALILFPVCRNTLTWLRNKTRLGVAVPFDDNFKFHQVIAVGILVGVVLHAGTHLACDFPRVLAATDEAYAAYLAKYLGGDRPESYGWFLKGWEGITGISMVLLMAIAFTLATPWLRNNRNLPNALKKVVGFNAFWYSHHSFVLVYALLLIHGFKLYLTKDTWQKTTWMYIAVPVILYACERLTRALRSGVKPAKILSAIVYPGNLLTIKMSKPNGFEYKSGQYMFVNCSTISPFEWHPFSITSSPGEDYLSVHIRSLGDWTKKLNEIFSGVCHPPADGETGLLRSDGNNPSLPKIQIDGAYGAPAQEYMKYDVVLLIGLGIGATPMISIIKDIVHNTKTIDEESQSQTPQNATSPHTPTNTADVFKTKKAYFYWVTPEQGTFDWFKEIMNEVAEIDTWNVVEMHNYCTSVYEEGDARSALVTMLQTIHHEKNGTDVVAGTTVRSHFAKPDWGHVYKNIANDHPDTTVGVFYCGPPGPIKDLKHYASELSHKTSTTFDFYKENF